MEKLIKNKSILVTGGTGSFGKKFVEYAINNLSPKKLVIFSRDELKQFEMASQYPLDKFPYIRFFIGDIRDRDRVIRAFSNIDYVVHAAAMKQIVASEYNPTECIATNIIGAQNIIDSSLINNVSKVVALSTDKAANPINLYGATKLCSDKLFVAANNLSGLEKTRFSVVRYGNVVGLRGSIIPYFKDLINNGEKTLPLTHEEMTRFFITLDQGVGLVAKTLSTMFGGEIIVPKLPSVKIIDIVKAFGENINYKIIGIRPGEKLHEVMIPQEEVRNTFDMGKYFIIQPNHHWWNISKSKININKVGTPMKDFLGYVSDRNNHWLNHGELVKLISNS